MKNTGPPDSNHKTLKLTPELTRFVENMGVFFENEGVPRIGGRILALLMLSHRPLSAEEIASTLKVSRASISTNIRLLIVNALAEKVSFHGDRTTYYAFLESAWEQAMKQRVQSIVPLKKIAEQGLAALPTEGPARQRLEGMIEWSEFAAEFYQKIAVEWRARYPNVLQKG